MKYEYMIVPLAGKLINSNNESRQNLHQEPMQKQMKDASRQWLAEGVLMSTGHHHIYPEDQYIASIVKRKKQSLSLKIGQVLFNVWSPVSIF